MIPQNLAEFLESLAAAGALSRIEDEVDADLEIAAAADGALKGAAPRGESALLFERVRGHRQVVVANLFGSVARVCRALGVESLDHFVERAAHQSAAAGKPSWLDRLKSRSAESPLERFAPKTVKVGPCQQVVKLGRDIDLGELPALRSWPDETMRSITAGLLYAGDASSGGRSLSRVVLPIVNGSRLALVIDPFLPAWPHWEQARSRGEKLPVAIVLGGCPALSLLADLPLGGEADLLALAGMWGEQPLSLVRCRTQPLDVPAEAEIVLEGFVDPAAPRVASGTIAAPSGLYHQRADCPVIQLTAITHRTNAAFPATVFAAPPSEATALDRLAERLLLLSLQAQAPEVVDLAISPSCAQRSVVYVSLRTDYPHAARRVASAIWGHPRMMLTKLVVLVAAGVNVHDEREVMFRVSANLLPERDVFTAGGPMSPFDPSAATAALGTKLALDATGQPEVCLPSPAADQPPH